MAGRYDRAERLYAQSRALAEELDDRKVLAAVRHSEGVLAHCRGDFAGAREALLDSLARLRELPAGRRRPVLPGPHASACSSPPEGPGGAPRMYFEETVQFFRRVDARHAVGYVLAALGDVARAQGLIEPARERAGREPGALPRGARRDGHGVRAEPPRQPRRRDWASTSSAASGSRRPWRCAASSATGEASA